jgi:hypothetical protein
MIQIIIESIEKDEVVDYYRELQQHLADHSGRAV